MGGSEALRAGPLAVGVAIAVAACAGPLARGEREFAQGRYPEAKRTFAALVDPARRGSFGRCVERGDGRDGAVYALYRGLTLAALGDVTRAASWLDEARSRQSRCPGALSPDDARRLAVALDAFEPPASAAEEVDAGLP